MKNVPCKDCKHVEEPGLTGEYCGLFKKKTTNVREMKTTYYGEPYLSKCSGFRSNDQGFFAWLISLFKRDSSIKELNRKIQALENENRALKLELAAFESKEQQKALKS